jgi:hypothetical protein
MNLLTSIRRTVVPMVMGWLMALPMAPYVDAQAVEMALVAMLGAVYYGVTRFLEDRGFPFAGWMVGFGSTPAPEYPE